ncbi:Pentapeptide repeat-containing protein [Myroides marinus]|uniref:Pentapeptide repeat-containing protein n=1 Tax=Myroides marinus TaxID=703342 RepID=A0A1H6Y6N7_9FLAO|nr:pentapeptide repeat-containing protein [Myroides marinus]SEJ35564.1 Pentapeptide repeat-containing protein [Myroides marinus]
MNDDEIEKIADLVIKKSKEAESINKENNRLQSLYLIPKSEKKSKEENENEIENEKRKLRKADECLISSGRIEKKDIKFSTKNTEFVEGKKYHYIEDIKYDNYLFVRGIATDFIFRNIDFSKTIFDSCYFKDCRFINCKFEGAKFMNSNLQGSYYRECNFDYVLFEKTFVDFEIFECAPKWDNLRFRFARSLKLNYASLGDYIKASKAVAIELEATLSHLKSSWLSGEQHYVKKYGGLKGRGEQGLKWIKVFLLDFVWGNGESLRRLIRLNLILFFVLTIYHYYEVTTAKFSDFLDIFLIKIPANYFNIKLKNPCFFDYYPTGLSLFLVISRLVCFGLLMSIIIKKYNRR